MQRLQTYLGEVVNQTFGGYMQMQGRAHSGNVSFHKQLEVVTANFTKMHSGTMYLYNKPMHSCLFDKKQKQNHTCSLLVKIYQNFETLKFFMKNPFASLLYICTIRHLLNILKLEPVYLRILTLGPGICSFNKCIFNYSIITKHKQFTRDSGNR